MLSVEREVKAHQQSHVGLQNRMPLIPLMTPILIRVCRTDESQQNVHNMVRGIAQFWGWDQLEIGSSQVTQSDQAVSD